MKRTPCPHCGSTFLTSGWGRESKGPYDGKDFCQVKCRSCQASGPKGETEKEAWELWGRASFVDMKALDKHVKLCVKNLNRKGVKCCLNCPFERIIVDRHPEMSKLFFWAKRGVSVSKVLKEAKVMAE